VARVIDESIDWAQWMEAGDDGRAKVRPASEFAGDVVRLLHGDSEEAIGQSTPWAKVGDRLRFRPGEVTLWAGINGHGKSNAIGYLALHFLAEGSKACIASMEMPPAATMGRMCRQAASRGMPPIDFIERFHRWTDGKLWLYAHQGQVKSDRMIAVARYCRVELGVDHIVIDSLLKCGMAPDDYAGQKNFVDALCALARDTGLHIHLVHHVRKGSDEKKEAPDKFDIKGAGEICDLVDNVLIVFRNKQKEDDMLKAMREKDEAKREKTVRALEAQGDTFLRCEKQRHFTWEGAISLFFDRDSQQLREHANVAGRYLDFNANEWRQEWRP
jgi:twinkle protein